MSKAKPPPVINSGKIKVDKKLGAGCFGEVHRGTIVEGGAGCAIKFEGRSDSRSAPQLHHEYEVLKMLSDGGGAVKDEKTPGASPNVSDPQGIAIAHYFGEEGNFNCLAMEMLGYSLEDRVQKCGGKLKANSTTLIALQVLQRIEYLHSRGYVHRDIKPENFMFGVGPKVHHVYIIDFGLSKRFWDKQRQEHVGLKQKMSLTGTARYASINAHKGLEQSRRDDLEAISHMFLYFLRGSLPWSGLEAKTQEEKYRKIVEKKEQTPLEDLCRDHPDVFKYWLNYARNLGFKDKPTYTVLWSKLNDQKHGEDHSFEWEVKIPDNVEGGLTKLYPRVEFQQPDDEAKQQAKGCCTIM